MLHHREGARFPPDVTLGIQAKEFNLGFIRPENLVSHGLRVLKFILANSKRAVMCIFTEEWLPSGHSTIKAWLVECCSDGCPSGRFWNSRALSEWPSGSWSPPWPRPFTPDCSVWPALGRVLVVHRPMCSWGCCRNVLVSSPRSVPRHNPVSWVLRIIPSNSWLALSTVETYIDRCVPF